MLPPDSDRIAFISLGKDIKYATAVLLSWGSRIHEAPKENHVLDELREFYNGNI